MIVKTVLLSLFSFMYYLVVSKNITYLYSHQHPINAPVLDSFLLLILLLKLSFSGFSLGLLLRLKFAHFFQKIHTWMIAFSLSYLVLGVSGLNYVALNGGWFINLISVIVLFIPSLLFGILYGRLVADCRGRYSRMLVLFALGSGVSVIIYNYIFLYVPFFLQYVGLSIGLQVLYMRRVRHYNVLSVIFMAVLGVYFLSKPNFGQIYTGPHIEDYELVKTIMGRYGIIDLLYSPSRHDYLTLSDKQSPSSVAIKGDISRVDPHVSLPYELKKYSRVLIIGVGGGQDIVSALHFNADRITAVDIDKERNNLLQYDFSEYSKGLVRDPRVGMVAQSGRSFLRTNKEKYDLIVIQRPWTGKISNSFLYDTSGELFTEDGLDAYIHALRDGGVLYWGVAFNPQTKEKILVPLKKKYKTIKDDLIIFYPYQDREFLAVFIGKSADFSAFYTAHKHEYRFSYVPPMVGSIDSDISMYLDSPSDTISRTDKQIYGVLDTQTYNKRLFFILTLFIFGLIMCIGRSLHTYTRHLLWVLMYFLLGMGYELVSIFFLLWLQLFFSNSIVLLPIVFSAYYVLGSIGYAHAAKASREQVLVICVLLVGMFVGIVTSGASGSRFIQIIPSVALLLFVFSSYFIAFPFGFLIQNEKNFGRAMVLDYIGSLFYLPIIFFLPHTDYIVIIVVTVYICVGFLLYIDKRMHQQFTSSR